jgi:cytochrome P450
MMVLNETLRLEPPVIFSSLMTVNDPIEISGININTKDNILVNLHQLHHDPDQW